MTFSSRPLTLADLPALAVLYDAAEAVDDTGEHYNLEDHEEEFANPDLDLDRDTVGVFDGDELVGYGSFLARKSEGDRKAYVFGTTHPERRGEGVGTSVLEALVARGAEVQATADSPLRLLANAQADNRPQNDLLAAAGFTPERWSFVMRRDVGGGEPAALPPGYDLRTYRPADAEPWRIAHNVAFLDHPNFAPWDASEWDQWVITSRAFRPELTFIVTPAERPDEIAAYLQTNEYDAYEQATGRREAFVAKVGTLPAHRGQGLAAALLRHALVEYAAAGYHESGLDVDSLNPTGALGIYERAGFEVERRFVTYELAIGAES